MLSGSLNSFGLLDVLRLLSSARVVGELRLQRNGDLASIHLAAGRIVGAALGGRDARVSDRTDVVEDVMVHLATWRSGEFWFEGAPSPLTIDVVGEPEGLDLDEVSPRLLDRLDSLSPIWRLVAQDEPAMLKLASDPPPGLSNIQLSLEEWSLLVNLNIARPVDELAARCDVNPTVALERLRRLIQSGLVEVLTPPAPPEAAPVEMDAPRPFSVAVLCTANRARSAFVARLIEDATRGFPVEVMSYGIEAEDARPPLPHAVTAAAELGIDLQGSRSAPLPRGALRDADLVIGFETRHVTEAIEKGGAAARRTFTLGQLVSILRERHGAGAESTWRAHESVAWAHQNRTVLGERAQGFDVADPAGAPLGVFRTTFATIKALVDELLAQLFGAASLVESSRDRVAG